jgi:hypothetical protein
MAPRALSMNGIEAIKIKHRRRYALRAVKQRLHQASFREAVITAHSGRCALSGLPESLRPGHFTPRIRGNDRQESKAYAYGFSYCH